MSAMRNLNTRELHGRNLRVDHATRDHGIDKEQPQASVNRSGTVGIGGPVAPPVESLYGPSCNPADAPELISQAINSLPPEQMYKLIKEMKDVIMVCPNELTLNQPLRLKWPTSCCFIFAKNGLA